MPTRSPANGAGTTCARPRLRRLLPIARSIPVVRTAAGVVLCLAVGLCLGADHGPLVQRPAAESTAVDTATVVDDVVRTTVRASVTLSAPALSNEDAQRKRLLHTSADLRAASDRLDAAHLPAVPEMVTSDARERLSDLAGRVERAAACLSASQGSADLPAARSCAEGSSPSQDSAAARSAGAAVALLLPYGTLSVEQVSAYAQTATQTITQPVPQTAGGTSAPSPMPS